VLAMSEARADRTGEELADRFAEASLARTHNEKLGVDLLSEVLDRHRRVADELANFPVDAVTVEHISSLRFNRRELAFAGGDVDVDRRGVNISIGVFVRDEARHVDVNDEKRHAEQLGVAASFFQHSRRLSRDHSRDHSTLKISVFGRLSIEVGGGIRHGMLLRHCGHYNALHGWPHRRGADTPCYSECYSYRLRSRANVEAGTRIARSSEMRGSRMGRGRQKAKHTKIARELKSFSPSVNYSALERELGHPANDDQYVDKWADQYADEDEDELERA
jgi:hypothetical protein